ncbi:(2Fe-2S)-binding protein [Brevirhabdus pacifica]|uniref:(2Fe-2S)-binding protein n=1 Tax=Brevirhabdus pacifica TaxID=1267768 RepID=A0A1U7DFT0_9RHOB|nr:(2Fe-2S)-binding protein [Brevirhabdus pacifica]APX88753.1 (2Fe-2S)-binding protein [Brevirhabdus pacifica]OWU80008.1 (2Fe-2S)-binding protein [Loktanella sp. 22II-4b]PJJ86723.1 nicotinate dehydrogenase subunit A [Brevirhabdus pacifica]
MSLTLRINGRDRQIDSDPDTPLLFVLRDELKLKGAKLGCGLEQCGACFVLADGEAVPSCVTPAAVFADKQVVTIEGLAERETGARVQRAFVDARAAQCGYCTAGMVVAATALLEAEPGADRDRARVALERNICRCGSHPRVLDAIEKAAKTT